MANILKGIKARPTIYALATVGIVATGVYAGADLKTSQQVKKEVTKIREATPEEKIALLERSKEPLLYKKKQLEAKIEELQAIQRGEKVVRNKEKILGHGR